MSIEPAGLVAIPGIALSVRQPWAWAIIHAGKDVENRSWQAIDKGNMRRGRIAIHASRGLTQDEYYSAAAVMERFGVQCPPAAELKRGGIIGAVDVVDIVTTSDSRWYAPGNRALVLRNPLACAYVPAIGYLGYFRWTPSDQATVPEPARWMIEDPNEMALAPGPLQIDMFG